MRPETAQHGKRKAMPRSRVSAGRGFALVSAIFLLVVLAALGAYMLVFSSVQHSTSAQDVNGSRAYQAARAGMEWGVYQVLRNPGFVCGGTTPLDALPGSLAGFAVNVACISEQAIEGAVVDETTGVVVPNKVTLYRLTSTASTGVSGSGNYVERRLQALVEK